MVIVGNKTKLSIKIDIHLGSISVKSGCLKDLQLPELIICLLVWPFLAECLVTF